MDRRKQMIYQKNEFNNSSICILQTIFKCSKCKKNNTILGENKNIQNVQNVQNCLFCGNPNSILKKK